MERNKTSYIQELMLDLQDEDFCMTYLRRAMFDSAEAYRIALRDVIKAKPKPKNKGKKKK